MNSGHFKPGNRAGASGRRTFKTFLAEVERDNNRDAVVNGLREAINDARARLKELRARQVARRVPRAQKEKAAREARLLTTRLISLADQMRPFVLDEPAAPVSPADAVARLHEAVRKANEFPVSRETEGDR